MVRSWRTRRPWAGIGTERIVFERGILKFAHQFLEGLFESRCLEQRLFQRQPRDRLVRLENSLGNLYVDIFARLQIHPEPTEHDRNEPAYVNLRATPSDRMGRRGVLPSGPNTGDQVEVVAWLWNLFWSWRTAFELDE
jgi:hypothetical protein